MKFVKNITGPGTSSAKYGFPATDLGISVIDPHNRNRLLTFFGDSFSGDAVGRGRWMSPVLAYSDARNFRSGLTFDGVWGGNQAAQILPYTHGQGFDTVLPGGAIVIGKTIYLQCLVCSRYPDVLWTELQASDDGGKTWRHTGVKWDGHHDRRAFQMWAPVDFGDSYIYVFSSSFQRDMGIHLYRVPKSKFLDKAAYEPWGYNGREWGWGNPPTPVFGTKVGEMSAFKIGGDLVIAYFDATRYRVDVKVLKSPIDNFYAAPTTTVVRGGRWPSDPGVAPVDNWQAGVMAQVYGAFIIPGSTHEDLHIVVSQWRNPGVWPYLSNQYKTTIQPRNPKPKEETVMADPTTVFTELVDDPSPVALHVGRKDANGNDTSYRTGRLRDIVKATGFEITLWTKRRGLKKLLAKRTGADTMVGHANDAASFGEINFALLQALAIKQLGAEETARILAPFQDEQ